jgi:glucans biosynthesis protein C
MNSAPATTPVTRQRRQDLDLMRIAVVGGLIFYHTACIFSGVGFYVSNRPPNLTMTAFVFFGQLWGMPLLFMVAGAGLWHSLRARTISGFIRERLSRLLIPLVVGILLAVPPQVYYALRAGEHPPGSYWQFLGRFFDVRVELGLPASIGGDEPDGLFEMAHLWFLYYLLTYSLLFLPAFLYLQRDSGRRVVHWLTARCQRPWGMLLLALPVFLVEAALGTWEAGGWNGYSFIAFLFYGFLIAADRRLGEAVSRARVPALVIGLAALPVLFVIAHYDIGGPGRVLGMDYDPWSIAWRLLEACAGWAWTIATFGFITAFVGRVPRQARQLPTGTDERGAPAGARRAGRISRYAKEAVLPVYVLHGAPIVIIGFYVIEWRIGILAKYLVICFASLAATLLVYDVCIRRASLTRVLFGLPTLERRGDPVYASSDR